MQIVDLIIMPGREVEYCPVGGHYAVARLGEARAPRSLIRSAGISVSLLRSLKPRNTHTQQEATTRNRGALSVEIASISSICLVA